MKTTYSLIALAALLAASTAQAQSSGDWLVKAGANQIAPKVSSDELSPPALPDTRIDVEAKTALIFTAAYMWTDNVSFEFFGGLPYKHDIVGDGAIEGIKLGKVKQVSPTLLAQYRFGRPDDMFRPYVGAGVTYAYFYGTEGSAALTATTNPGGPPTTSEVDSKWAVSFQLGLNVKIDDHWFVDASLIKTPLKTTTHLSTGQSIATKLDPLSFGLAVGYRFR
ncbi:MAG: outer membrane beta-barrel protein [Proteobacteria bacterium]|nr:outer membrane beta-barrel protein [Pseudomonadota bacterium]